MDTLGQEYKETGVLECEYMTLRLVADTALGLLARHPFDDAETMAPRWHMLAIWLACLPDYPKGE